MEINLTLEEKSALESQHKKSRNVKECYRINAVLLRSEGWSISMIAQALRIHDATVSRHLNDYQKGKLNIESGGSTSLLSEEQTAELVQHLEEHTYQTTQAIALYIKGKYGKKYTVPGLNKWLHRNGFSYKKPKGIPRKASIEEQEDFVASYNEMQENLAEDETIMFMDSAHPSMATKITHGWIKKGQDKPIETTASRTRMNIVGALDLDDISGAVVETYPTINGENIADFLHKIRNNATVSGAIHLVLDGAGYHRSKEVMNAAEKLNINLVFLPPYSPNLNPIERLWKVMNEMVRNNKFFKSAKDFKRAIINFFKKTLPKIGCQLEDRINDNFQKLNHAF